MADGKAVTAAKIETTKIMLRGTSRLISIAFSPAESECLVAAVGLELENTLKTRKLLIFKWAGMGGTGGSAAQTNTKFS